MRIHRSIGTSRHFAALVKYTEQELSGCHPNVRILLDIHNIGEIPHLTCSWEGTEYTAEIVHRLAAAAYQSILQGIESTSAHLVIRNQFEQWLQQNIILNIEGFMRFRLQEFSTTLLDFPIRADYNSPQT